MKINWEEIHFFCISKATVTNYRMKRVKLMNDLHDCVSARSNAGKVGSKVGKVETGNDFNFLSFKIFCLP